MKVGQTNEELETQWLLRPPVFNFRHKQTYYSLSFSPLSYNHIKRVKQFYFLKKLSCGLCFYKHLIPGSQLTGAAVREMRANEMQSRPVEKLFLKETVGLGRD